VQSYPIWRINLETIQFEAIKTALKQTKDGYGLSLAVHPADLPDELMRDFVGSRYMVVMVRIGDNEQPVNRELEFPGDYAVKMAGMMCRDPSFWQWVNQKTITPQDIKSEKECANWLSDYLNIQSRKELKENEKVREEFNKLRKSFEIWKRS
jgi:hypothetical protein